MTNHQRPALVLDASVLINLASTTVMGPILRSLPESVLVVDHAFAEVWRDPRTKKDAPDLLRPFMQDDLITRVDLDPEHAARFVELTGAPEPDDLDDGEAASIAYATLSGASVGLDDSKPTRICRTLFPSCGITATVELFRRNEVIAALGPEQLSAAVFDALQYGRMRVPQKHLAWVVDLISPERAATCTSLRRNACCFGSRKARGKDGIPHLSTTRPRRS